MGNFSYISVLFIIKNAEVKSEIKVAVPPIIVALVLSSCVDVKNSKKLAVIVRMMFLRVLLFHEKSVNL